MKTGTRTSLGLGALGISLVTTATVLPAGATSPTPAPIAVDMLTPRSAFTDDVSLRLKVRSDHGTSTVRLRDPSLTAVARITVQPGARFPLHRHPGPVFVNVAQGEITYVGEHCEKRVYPVGTAFVDTGTDVHSAYGSGSKPTILIATFLGAPAKGPLTIPEAVQTTCD